MFIKLCTFITKAIFLFLRIGYNVVMKLKNNTDENHLSIKNLPVAKLETAQVTILGRCVKY